ncbi:Tfp pilus assembly protein PilF [Pararhizobium capsulatum DSM 1112]|uniref:Tfp pilus assembly protein PilF n=1 Tax=Pararhizobium capsulatum DSM 1112 TaxID=1121113 RepID=A0ABU0BKJ5_9HYPH|nr:FecR domain-containing protein [Pararhizobium capsulatum]MDQ0318527.1 Tfp pilus assembly protein PilF [Pararhizobium capsulatum DSM 1112]
MRVCIAVVAALGSILPIAASARADVVARPSTAEGSVISRKSGEEARFIELHNWRGVDVDQALLAGDILRTNAVGRLAILFADDTQVRMGRNTTLVVKSINTSADSRLELQGGTIWARAKRGGNGIAVDTPAAAAAIRGTDWTLTVEGDHTTLSVLEGSVSLSNPQGSVTVARGEGATVSIGQAPRKYTLVNLEEREQILLYSELRGIFSGLAVSNRKPAALRAERARILALGENVRSPEDRVLLAEAALEYDGFAAAKAALASLPRPLPSPLEARAKLVEAMIAGDDLRYEQAANLFRAAMPGLSRDRRASAAYGLWFAEALANPDRQLPPPNIASYDDSPVAILAQASVIANDRGMAAAIDFLKAAEKRFPDDARLPTAIAGLAFELDRRDEVREALARALALDPDSPAALLTSARFRTAIDSDLDGALAELEHAVKVAPGADAVWNEIGIVQSDRNAIVEADDAHRRAIELNPQNAALYANYARFLMDNEQIRAAKSALDIAEKLDAKSYAVLAAKGRYLLRMGQTDEGERTLLEASSINPTYGDSLIGLAIAAYQLGNEEEAIQALDNADRYENDNPSIPLIRSGIALDQFRADEAIIQAREALKRRQARGGYYSGYDANRQVTSFLGITLDNLGLSEWGEYYADRGYDPFKGSSYLDEADSGRNTPFSGDAPLLTPQERKQPGSSTFSSQMQALMLDPMAVAGETRRNSLEGRAFFEAALTGGVMWEKDGDLGWRDDLLLQGTSYATVPMSYYLQAEMVRPESPRENDRDDLKGVNAEIGLRPTLEDNIFLFANAGHRDQGYPGPDWNPTPYDVSDTDFANIGIGWAHTISDRNVIQAFVAGNDIREHTEFDYVDFFGDLNQLKENTRQRTLTAGISHMLGIGPVTLRYGAEGSVWKGDYDYSVYTFWNGDEYVSPNFESNGRSARLYADALWEIDHSLQVQGGIYYNWAEDYDDCGCVDPRIGIAWAPIENHWLRAYYREDTSLDSSYTLSPISTVGLAPLDLPLVTTGQSKTAAVRWDAEWSERFFTAVEYQHQTLDGLSLRVPDVLYTRFGASEGRIDRLNLSANYWIGGGLGAYGSFTLIDSTNTSPGVPEDIGLPLVPEYLAQLGLTYVDPSRWTATVGQTFVGKRAGTDSGLELDPVSLTNIGVSWKSPDGHLETSLQLLNVFDTDFDVAEGVAAPGRTLLGSIRARF